jgi:hypothetical protein
MNQKRVAIGFGLGRLALSAAIPLMTGLIGPWTWLVAGLGLSGYAAGFLFHRHRADGLFPVFLFAWNIVCCLSAGLLFSLWFGLLPGLLAAMHGGMTPPFLTGLMGKGPVLGSWEHSGALCSFGLSLVSLMLAGAGSPKKETPNA